MFEMESGKLGPMTQPGGPVYGLEHCNGGIVTFGGGAPLRAAAAAARAAPRRPHGGAPRLLPWWGLSETRADHATRLTGSDLPASWGRAW